MIVYVKEIGTRRTPFAMRKESAERLIASNKGKYELVGGEVEPIQQIEPLQETSKKKVSRKKAVELLAAENNIEDLREE